MVLLLPGDSPHQSYSNANELLYGSVQVAEMRRKLPERHAAREQEGRKQARKRKACTAEAAVVGAAVAAAESEPVAVRPAKRPPAAPRLSTEA